MKITISGTLGSGKSTVGKLLAKELNYNYYYTGGITRNMAEKKGMTLLEFTKLRETHPEINLEIDEYQRKIGEKENNFVIDGHLGFHFVPDSIKIFLKCDLQTATTRILKSLKEGNKQRITEGLETNHDKIINSLEQRHATEVKQYVELYNVDIDDESNFDIVIDTSNISPEEICKNILTIIKNKQSSL
ncbi:MAG: cytidylate kinase family protein [Candidatus Woesearchaeota archaeon]|jgi:predicted cytidylate kinase